MSKRIHTQSSLKHAVVAPEAPEGVTRGVAPGYFEKRSKKVHKRPKAVYVFDATRSAPEVGDTVAIIHRTKAGKNGTVTEARSDIEQRKVKLVYMADSLGYSIQDNAGEVWLIKPATMGSSKWETVGVHHG